MSSDIKTINNLIIERRINISEILNNFFPNVIAKVISEYDYHLEGKPYTLVIDYVYGFGAMSGINTLPNGNIALCSKSNFLVEIRNPRFGTTYSNFKHYYNTSCIAVMPNEQIVCGTYHNTLEIWQYDSIKFSKSHEINHVPICVAALHDGRIVYAFDENLRIWNPFGTLEPDILLIGHSKSINCIAVLPDGRIISGSSDKTLKLWDIKTQNYDVALVRTFKGHTNRINCVVIISNEIIVSGSDDGTLKIWDIKTGKKKLTLKGHYDIIRCVNVLHDGRIVSGSHDKTLRIWNQNTGKCENILSGHNHWITCVNTLHDGRIISGSFDTLKIWS
jgi:hypothetical protein